MNIRGIDFTVYPCSDYQRSLSFYRDVIGLKLEEEWGGFYAEFDVGGQTFSIISKGWEYKPGSSGGSVAFNVENLFDALAELKAKGVEPCGKLMETPVCRFVCVPDPDGNVFILHERTKVE